MNTKDQLLKIISILFYWHLSSLTVLNSQCRGFLMFFLKSGSAISTHNAFLCPLMLWALIVIEVVPLSTSSLTSKTHTHRIHTYTSRKCTMRKLKEVPSLVSPLRVVISTSALFFFCSSLNLSPRTNRGMLLSVKHIFNFSASCLWNGGNTRPSRWERQNKVFLFYFNPSSLSQHDGIQVRQCPK